MDKITLSGAWGSAWPRTLRRPPSWVPDHATPWAFRVFLLPELRGIYRSLHWQTIKESSCTSVCPGRRQRNRPSWDQSSGRWRSANQTADAWESAPTPGRLASPASTLAGARLPQQVSGDASTCRLTASTQTNRNPTSLPAVTFFGEC